MRGIDANVLFESLKYFDYRNLNPLILEQKAHLTLVRNGAH